MADVSELDSAASQSELDRAMIDSIDMSLPAGNIQAQRGRQGMFHKWKGRQACVCSVASHV